MPSKFEERKGMIVAMVSVFSHTVCVCLGGRVCVCVVGGKGV
jgi:hypothetical protein